MIIIQSLNYHLLLFFPIFFKFSEYSLYNFKKITSQTVKFDQIDAQWFLTIDTKPYFDCYITTFIKYNLEIQSNYNEQNVNNKRLFGAEIEFISTESNGNAKFYKHEYQDVAECAHLKGQIALSDGFYNKGTDLVFNVKVKAMDVEAKECLKNI